MTASTTTNTGDSANADSFASRVLYQRVLGSRRFSLLVGAMIVSGSNRLLLAGLSSYLKVNLLPLLTHRTSICSGLVMAF